MSGHVYLRGLLHFGLFRVTCPAELPGFRFRRFHRPGRYLMPLRYRVTGRAFEEGVRRYFFGPEDLRMARAAFVRRFRGHRTVGIVAFDAGFQWIMNDGIDLGKSGGP